MEKKNHFFHIPKEDRAIPLKDSYLEIEFNVSQGAAAHARYADGDHTQSVNLNPFAFFKKYRLTCSNGKEL